MNRGSSKYLDTTRARIRFLGCVCVCVEGGGGEGGPIPCSFWPHKPPSCSQDPPRDYVRGTRAMPACWRPPWHSFLMRIWPRCRYHVSMFNESHSIIIKFPTSQLWPSTRVSTPDSRIQGSCLYPIPGSQRHCIRDQNHGVKQQHLRFCTLYSDGVYTDSYSGQLGLKWLLAGKGLILCMSRVT